MRKTLGLILTYLGTIILLTLTMCLIGNQILKSIYGKVRLIGRAIKSA